MHQKGKDRPDIKVCMNVNCAGRGGRAVYEALLARRSELSMADIATTPNCFRLCQKGSNVAVDGNVLNFVKAADAVRRVQSEIRHPSRKTEGIGLRPIEDLDDVLDNLL